jgi:hypothetical protein
MADDDEEFDDDEPELDDDELEADDELELDDDVVAVVDADGDGDEVVVEEVIEDAAAAPAARTSKRAGSDDSGSTDEDEDDVVDLEEELHPDDVEEPLDVLLHERTTTDRLEEEATELDDDDLEPDAPGDASGRVVPRRDDEFLCRSCFLVKPLSQLARGEKDLCRDCE